MAAGPYSPVSITFDTSGEVYPSQRIDTRALEGIVVAASISVDRFAYLYWPLPPVLPSGTLKFILESIATATSGTRVLDVEWASVNVGENPLTIALTSEGSPTFTRTWTGADSGDRLKDVVTLDAFSGGAIGGEAISMRLVFDSTSSLSVTSIHLPYLYWED